MNSYDFKDFGEISHIIDDILYTIKGKRLETTSEAQTRFQVIDRIIREILQWKYGQIEVEEPQSGEKKGYIDYKLTSGDYKIIVEAKKIGASFPNPTKQKRLKLTGSVLGTGEIKKAIDQAEAYAISEKANVVIVTNGKCWCYYSLDNITSRDEILAYVLFPLDDLKDAELLFDVFCCGCVEDNSLLNITSDNPFLKSNKLLSVVRDADARIDRNNIADHIAPAIDNAIHGEALLDDTLKLKYCFVATDARTKFDKTLNIYITDSKPTLVTPARRIRKEKNPGELQDLVIDSTPSSSAPVTLIIGTVGAGKSTYLKHFELIEGAEEIKKRKCHWIYIDFEKLGKGGDPRKFIYQTLRDYLIQDHPDNLTDYKNVIEPIYKAEVTQLLKGPYALIKNDANKIDEKILELIDADYRALEPYVEKVLSYIAKEHLCVIILDNIDLYEDDELEVKVFSEGIAISKKIKCHTIMSIRDTTFVKHRNDSIFNAHELKKLWLDPPPFKEVLSKRLSYAKQILKNKKATINTGNNLKFTVQDLSVFFDIVQTSLLNETSGKFIESLSDGNIRRGINLVGNFLTSGHIRADIAIKTYLTDGQYFTFPYHEVFKGSVLGQWKYYKEERAELINLFDSKLNSERLVLVRLYILKYLLLRAKDANTIETPIKIIVSTFTKIGMSESQILKLLYIFQRNNLIRTTTAEIVHNNSIVLITSSGGYYASILFKRFEYIENIMYDTAIFNDNAWEDLSALSNLIETEHRVYDRVKLRSERMKRFIQYLEILESATFENMESIKYLRLVPSISKAVNLQLKNIESRAYLYHSL
ncbi:MAG: hypothetical protein JSS76_19165 [Bacteroidetes bacterium]|nr:hypothetical protein [Bacteroidota bacterium]